MHKIMFVCHGNICRSTMAEFVMKHLVCEQGLSDQWVIASAGTSREELGNDTHVGTKRVLTAHGIPFARRRAVQLTPADYDAYNYLVGMERYNMNNMRRLLGGDPQSKMTRLLDFTDHPGDIDDPWYTGRFEETYAQVYEGCAAMLGALLRQ